MSGSKGFTLAEVVIVMVIIGVLALVSVPTYTTTLQQGAAKSTQNNLIAIYNAQKDYFFKNNKYCVTTTATSAACAFANCGASLAAINCNLSLNIVDNYNSYTCVTGVAAANGFSCSTTNLSDATFTQAVSNIPIITPGGTGCTTGVTGDPAPCNPVCTIGITPHICPT